METKAYPLSWPAGWPRTDPDAREFGRFKVSPGVARDHLLAAIELLNGEGVVISSDLPLRKDGLPYAGAKAATPGVAVYFRRNGRPMVLACDRFRTIEANMRAIGLSLEAMRGLERWGASQLMERAFMGFTALPAPVEMGMDWRAVLGFGKADKPVLRDVIWVRNQLIKKYHPDTGTEDRSAKRTAAINDAFAQAEKELLE